MIKIQKKWKNLKLRKMMYKATIRNYWNKNIPQFFFMIKKEKLLEKNLLTQNPKIDMDLSVSSPSNSANLVQKLFFYPN